ncbi:MAG: DUF47 family protein [Calditrichaeota bacterium]|nr:DUF47 family protein [Calditrichota bacterium]
MRLDHIIQRLLPHDEKFFIYFNESAHNITEASKLLLQIPEADAELRAKLVSQINDLEHIGDAVTHKIFNELNSTFVTPFDPEDIHILASALDDILDNMDGSARRFTLYKISEFPHEMVELIKTLHKSIVEIEEGIKILKGFKQPARMQEVIKKVNEYENEADVIFARAIAHLLENETNAVEIIKKKEIFVMLELATDKCEDVANVLDTIVLKHA